jgi:NTP pyrophosphatase (non-canonical NTP hydrolase)
VAEQEPTLLGKMARGALQDSERWFGDQQQVIYSVPYYALCLAGEVGEFCNVVKKIERGSLSLKDSKTRFKLAAELTDAFVYMLNIAALMNIDLGRSYEIIRAANQQRFTEQRIEREAAAAEAASEPPSTPGSTG